MKKLINLFLMLIITFAIVTQSSANEGQNLEGTRRGKLKRGLINIVTSPLEVFAQMKEECRAAADTKTPKPIAMLTGLVKGAGMTAVRLSAGVVETLTFNLEFPKKNYGVLLLPEHVCEHFKDHE